MADQLTINPGAITTAHGKLRIEQFDVLIVGAGLSGIGAAYHLQTECPGKSFVILEARNATGGTWDLFRYPGIRSDSDMFTLGYRFRPWRESKAIADGPSILRYIRETAAEHGIDSKIRFGHHVTRACWSSEDARWMVEADRRERRGRSIRLQLPLYVQRLLRLLGRLHAGLAGNGTIPRPDRASAKMARGFEISRQADCCDRQRRNGGDAGSRDDR